MGNFGNYIKFYKKNKKQKQRGRVQHFYQMLCQIEKVTKGQASSAFGPKPNEIQITVFSGTCI